MLRQYRRNSTATNFDLLHYRIAQETNKELQGLEPNDCGVQPERIVLEGHAPDLRSGQLYREMEVGYSRLVTISTDKMLATNDH